MHGGHAGLTRRQINEPCVYVAKPTIEHVQHQPRADIIRCHLSKTILQLARNKAHSTHACTHLAARCSEATADSLRCVLQTRAWAVACGCARTGRGCAARTVEAISIWILYCAAHAVAALGACATGGSSCSSRADGNCKQPHGSREWAGFTVLYSSRKRGRH